MPVASNSFPLRGDRTTPYGPRSIPINHHRDSSGPALSPTVQDLINRKRFHKNWSEHRNSADAVTLISSTGLLFTVQDYYLKANRYAGMQTSLDLRQLTDVSNSTFFGSDLKAPPTATSYKATARPVDLQHVPPQVISLFLDLVVHDDNRLSTITKAEQYLQIRAFAQRYAIPRLFTCLQGVRDKVKENDPFGFMKVLTDEAVSQYQAREIESRVESLIFKLQNQSGDDEQLIADSTWDTTNKALTSLNLSISRSRSKAPTISRGGRLSSDAQSMISEGVSEVLAEVQKLFDTREGQEKARNRVYHSEEMKESILALHNHFYITSENHFPARWSSYGDTTYSNNVVESDTPAHALPTQVAQALGIPFYRAFTFSLNDALIQQDFRSGYTRAPQDPPPFHQQDRPSTEQPREADGSTIRLSLEPAGGHTSHPGPAAYPVEPSSPIVHGSSNQERDDTANSCAAPYRIHMDDDHRNLEEQNATVQRPPSPSTFKSPPNPLDNLPSVSKTQFSAPPSITDTHLIPPSMTQTQRKLGRKSTMDEVKRENENDTPSAFDRRDDQFDEGKQLWLDIWRGIVDYLPDELAMAEFGPRLTVWDEGEDLPIENESDQEDDMAEDEEMTGSAGDV